MSPTDDPTARLPSRRASPSFPCWEPHGLPDPGENTATGPGSGVLEQRRDVIVHCRLPPARALAAVPDLEDGIRGVRDTRSGPTGRGLPLGQPARARLQRHHPVRDREECRPVDDQQHGAALGQPAYRVDDARLRLAVQTRRRLVEQQQRPVGEEGPRQREPLSLARGETGTVLTELCSGTVRQRGHEVVGPCLPQRGHDRRVVRVRTGQPYVVRDRPGEEMRPLRHPRDLLAPAFRGESGKIGPADPHPPLVRNGEPQHHAEQRGLADSAGAGQGDGLPGLDHEGCGIQRGRGPAPVPDRHAVQLQPQLLRHVLGTMRPRARSPAPRRSPPRRRALPRPRGTGHRPDGSGGRPPAPG